MRISYMTTLFFIIICSLVQSQNTFDPSKVQNTFESLFAKQTSKESIDTFLRQQISDSSYISFKRYNKKDSTYRIWQDETLDDTIRARAFRDYVWNDILWTLPDSADKLADELFNFSRKVDYKRGIVLAYNLKFIAATKKKENDKAAFYLSQIAIVDEQIEKDEIKRRQLEENIILNKSHESKIKVKNNLNYLLIVIATIVIIVARILFIRYKRIRLSKNKIELEKNRSDSLLSKILPTEIADELKEKGYADAKEFEMVSVLFTDFKDYTKSASEMNPAELVKEINVCFMEFDNIIERYKIEKIKTIGDAYMAAGGLSIQETNSVKNTVLAALEMQKYITRRKEDNLKESRVFFEMRVGVNTGPVVAGIVGIKKYQYDVWGDTVNIASRLEKDGETGKVNISDSTYQHIKGDPDLIFTSRGKRRIKGKGETSMYFVEYNY